jgi:glycosyltransferase involved in cell wall biosynthesis
VRHLDSRMKLLIVGSGPELPKLLANSARLNLDDCTVFIPGTSEVAKYLHAIDIFVLSSRSEAFSNALLEAMASGCSTVGSDVGGTPELIGDNERGLLFRGADPADLARKLELLIQDSKLRSELAGRAARYAAEKLSIEIAALRMAEIYERLLRRKGAL